MLKTIPVPVDTVSRPLSTAASRLLVEANERISNFSRRQRPRIDNFVVCDFRLVDAALEWISEAGLACGDRFCEWGSGFGVVTMLAALRGWEAYGIEVEPALIEAAEQLAEDFAIDAHFAQGSFIPQGGEELLEFAEDIEHIDTDCPSGYDDLDWEIPDFDLFFAFPWPGEHRYWEAVFNHYASDGALLLTYHGVESLKLQRRLELA